MKSAKILPVKERVLAAIQDHSQPVEIEKIYNGEPQPGFQRKLLDLERRGFIKCVLNADLLVVQVMSV